MAPRSAHRRLLDRVASAVAANVGELDDHPPRAVTGLGDDHVDVVVVKRCELEQPRPDSEGLAFSPTPARRVVSYVVGPALVPKAGHGRAPGMEVDPVDTAVGERLHRPPLTAATECSSRLPPRGRLALR